MRLFFREHSVLIFVQAVQMLVILSIFWLDGYRDIKLFAYASFLNFFFLGCYLLYYYLSRKRMFQRLNQPLESLDDSVQKTDDAPISVAFDRVLRNQYMLYQSQLASIEKEQEEHRKYMDQWVHQMKTPLSVIELTAQNVDEPESSSIREETERMKMAMNTVLYMARLRTIEQDLHIKPVNLAKLVDEVNDENKRVFIRNKVYPTLEVEKDGMTVETDEKWLFFPLPADQ